MAQAREVCDRLREAFPEHEYEIVVISTKGDQIQNVALKQIGEKGIFVKEIERELLNGTIHLGVHSMKDMPAQCEKGLTFTKTWKREDPRDVLILREANSLNDLKEGAKIGTGSQRRACQLKWLRPDLQIVDIRGNVDTRLRKMKEQGLDGIVLACAGLKRLGMEQVITQYLTPEQMVPACGQGALALEIREDHEVLQKMLDSLAHEESHACIEAERSFLKAAGGGCHAPVGANCTWHEGTLRMEAVYGTSSIEGLKRVVVWGSDGERLGRQAAELLSGCKEAGMVYLAGAGPGDEELITVKGKRIIEEADCIIYDHLANPDLLKFAKPDCEKLYVGKENHRHVMRQEEINALLVQKAMCCQSVVRLKGGDPYVFGRGGEEGIYLRERGIPFEVIPGISSVTAGLAYGGIPITHRGVSKGFQVITAHQKEGRPAKIDYTALAKSEDTCVFLMGFSKIKEIAEGLLLAGKDPQCPVAVISNATLPKQRTCIGTLETIVQKTREVFLEPPALIVVGNVVRLRSSLNFFEEKPLFGKRYLVTKIGEETSKLTSGLREMGGDVTEIQTGEIKRWDNAVREEMFSNPGWIVLTSRHGVEAFFHSLKAQKIDLRALAAQKFAVVGKKTAEALELYGIYADLIPPVFEGAALCGELERMAGSKEQILYGVPKGEGGEEILRLKESHNVLEVCLYENQEYYEEVPMIPFDAAFFTCASSVKRLFGRLSDSQRLAFESGAIEAVSIGTSTTKALEHFGVCKIRQAVSATYEGMLSIVKSP